jgi:hypothetical protein
LLEFYFGTIESKITSEMKMEEKLYCSCRFVFSPALLNCVGKAMGVEKGYCDITEHVVVGFIVKT